MKKLSILAAAALALPLAVRAADVVRVPLPGGSKFPIASAVKVPAGAETLYVSGATADPLNAGGKQSWGDTEEQARSALSKLKQVLSSQGYGFGDVVQAHVFLAGDPNKGGKLDFAGLQKAWTEQFGTAAQPNLPARSAFQVAALANPNALVEIEVTAVHAH